MEKLVVFFNTERCGIDQNFSSSDLLIEPSSQGGGSSLIISAHEISNDFHHLIVPCSAPSIHNLYIVIHVIPTLGGSKPRLLLSQTLWSFP